MIQVMKKQAFEMSFSEASSLDKNIVVARSLRLLPYIIPSIGKWKRTLVKGKGPDRFVQRRISKLNRGTTYEEWRNLKTQEILKEGRKDAVENTFGS